MAGPSSIKDRLHFEVRCSGFDNQNVVDPYAMGLWISNANLEGALLLLLDDEAPVER